MNYDQLYLAGKSFANALQSIYPKAYDLSPDQIAANFATLCQDLFTVGDLPDTYILYHLPKAIGDQMIEFQNIQFVSLCEHHLMPIIGTIKLQYTPNASGYILGFGDILTIVKHYTRQSSLQEKITQAIAEKIHYYLDNQYVAVYTYAKHMCLSLKHQEQNSIITCQYIIDQRD